MTLTACVRRSVEAAGADPASATDAEAGTHLGAEAGPRAAAVPDAEGTGGARNSQDTRDTRCTQDTREADGMAVASFVLGLVGLLVMNILLGPAAIVMAVLALTRSTSRRGRALLGLALGVADLLVLATLFAGNGTISFSFTG